MLVESIYLDLYAHLTPRQMAFAASLRKQRETSRRIALAVSRSTCNGRVCNQNALPKPHGYIGCPTQISC